MTTTLRPTGTARLVVGLPQAGDEIDGVFQAIRLLVFDAQVIDATEPHTEEDGVVVAAQFAEREIAAKALVVAHIDTAYGKDVVDLFLRETVDRLVGGDAVFVQPTGLAPCLEDDDIMAVHGQPVRAGEPRGTCTDDRDALAGRWRAFVEMHVVGDGGIRGEALQQADPHRLALGGFAHAGLFAERFGGADAGAHAT